MRQRLHMARFGEGEHAFVGFHGWGSEHQKSFGELAHRLPEDASLHLLDMPGCGRSAPPDAWTWGAITRDLVEAIDHIAPDRKLNLIGSCSGSFHALEVARHRPERVEKIVLLEPFAFMPWFFSIFLTPVTGRALYKLVFDNPVGKAITSANMKRQGLNGDYDMVGAFANGANLDAAYRYLQFYDDIPGPGAFAPIEGPVRIVYGQKTFRAVRDSIDLWRENWPELEAIELEGVGHMITQEAPDRTAAAIFGGG